MGGQAAIPEQTIVRTRGELLVQNLITGTDLSGFRWAFGICIVTENAFGVGATAIPGPFTDRSWDGWFVYFTGSCFVGDVSVQGNNGLSAVSRLVIDSKAMRKFKFSDVMVGVFETVTEVGTAIIRADLMTRVLVKLP